MKYTLVYKPSAVKELLHLPKQYAFKVRTAINRLAENPRPAGSKKLEGGVNEYRIASRITVLFILFQILY